ncbi:uncharacterized protein [Macrobrachium rosenbergii]|uniref:uncharacterized protein n=1 Tax=Macrobrachium rosenbergii TaxID=79674 RepID=UPI0034D5F13C
MFCILFMGFWMYQPCFSFDEGVGEQEVGIIGHFLKSSPAFVSETHNIDAVKLVSRESYLSSTDGKGPNLHEVQPSKTIIQENFPAITSSSSFEESKPFPYLISKNYTITTDLGSFEADRSNYSRVKYKAVTNHVSLLSWQTPHSEPSVMPELFKSGEENTDRMINIAVPTVKDADAKSNMSSEFFEISESKLYPTSFLLTFSHSTMLANSILAVPTAAEETHLIGMENMDPMGQGKLSDMSDYDNPSYLNFTSNPVKIYLQLLLQL